MSRGEHGVPRGEERVRARGLDGESDGDILYARIEPEDAAQMGRHDLT